MNAVFGEFLALLLKNHGYTQQGLIDWLLANQSSPAKFKTPYSVKEHLRVARRDGLPAYQYPLLLDVARFFESKNELAAASRIRHIYLQQAYDTGRFNSLFVGASPHPKAIEWMIFPAIDRSMIRRKEWLQALNNGERQTLRESISFYYQYAKSHVHSPIRQMIAIDLARMAIGNAEYSDGYIIASTLANKWEEFMVREKGGCSYQPLLGDLFDYLTALQIKATAASHIYYYAPLRSSLFLFREAHTKLAAHRKLFYSNNKNVYEGLLINWHVRFLRMLCRSVMSLSQTGADLEDLKATKKTIRYRIAGLERRDFVDHFLVRDTLARSKALIAETEEEIDHVIESVRKVSEANAHDGKNQHSMTRYRVATTEAICAISKYRVLCNSGKQTRPYEALDAAGKSIKQIMDVVLPTRQNHIRLTIKTLINYLQALRIAEIESQTHVVTIDGLDALSIFVHDRKTETIQKELSVLDQLAKETQGVMFEINWDDSEHIECLVQANTFKRREASLDALRI